MLTWMLFISVCRYYSPSPTPCLSAEVTASPPLAAQLGPSPATSGLPRSKNGSAAPCTLLGLRGPSAAPAPRSTSLCFCCCSSYCSCLQRAIRAERRAEAAAAWPITSLFPSLRHTTWLCPTSCAASASLSCWWATPVRWRWPGPGRRRTSSTWGLTWRC